MNPISMLNRDQIKLRLHSLGIAPDKWLGQHFLIDQRVLDAMTVEWTRWLNPEDVIVEIGPGLGVLTRELVKTNHKVVAVERDPVLGGHLAQFLDTPVCLAVVKGDILRELETKDSPVISSVQGRPWVVIANIPYAITSPLLRKLAQLTHSPHHILVLVQKESAERICAVPGDSRRGLLSVELELYYKTEIIYHVPPSAFWPEPEVESALLVLSGRDEPLVPFAEQRDFLKVVQAGFSAKRKMLSNSLSASLQRSVEEMRVILQKAGIDSRRRAETLTIAEWQCLMQELKGLG